MAKIHGHSYKPGALTNKKSLAKSVKNYFYCKCKMFMQQDHFLSYWHSDCAYSNFIIIMTLFKSQYSI